MPDGTHRFYTNGAEVIRAFEAVPSGSLCYEETVIWGYLINLEKCSLDERLAMLGRYVPVLDNWAVCDSYCAHAKWMVRADKEALWAFLQPWFRSKREFEVRFAVVVAMCYFLSEEWLDKVFERINSLDFDRIKSDYKTAKGKPKVAQQGTVQGAEPYYVRMGWRGCWRPPWQSSPTKQGPLSAHQTCLRMSSNSMSAKPASHSAHTRSRRCKFSNLR